MIHSQSITVVPEFGQRPSAKRQSSTCCSLSLRERVREKGTDPIEHAKCGISTRLLSLCKEIANIKPHAQKASRFLSL